MRVEHQIPYNAMPETTRARIIQFLAGPSPIMADRVGGTGGRIFQILLGVGGLFGLFGIFGDELGEPYGFQKTDMLPIYAAGLFFGIAALLAAVRSFWADKAIPYKPGRYLTALDFVDARKPTFRFRPLSQLAGPIRIVDHYTNGIYSGTSMTLHFQGGGSESFSVRGKGRAETAIDALNEGTRAIRAAVEAGNFAGIAQHDPFIELRQMSWQVPTGAGVPQAGPVAKQPGFYFAHPWLTGLAAAAVLCYPVFLLRDKIHDSMVFSYLQKSGDVYDMQSYLDHGGSHSDEVRDVLLPRAAFEQAVRSGSVAALREFMKQYPKATQVPEARKILQDRYADARDKFHAEAADDKELVVAVDALLEWIAKNDEIKVPVKYRAPDNSLAELDAKLGDPKVVNLPGKTIVPIASHFTSEVSQQRETSVTSVIDGGMKAVFPSEVVQLEHAGRVPEGLGGQLAAAGEVKSPEIEVHYVVEPSGSVYTGEMDKTKVYIGIIVTFDVTLRVPGLKKPFTTTLKVEPPATFSVSQGADASEIYSVMAEKAFEELREKLIIAFFRPGSEAYKQATASLEAAEAERARNDKEAQEAPPSE